jgi:hypothetical protein
MPGLPLKVLKVKDVANLLGVTARTLAAWRKRKVGPDYIVPGGGKIVWYLERDIAMFGEYWHRGKRMNKAANRSTEEAE